MKMNFILILVILLTGIAYGEEVAKVVATPDNSSNVQKIPNGSKDSKDITDKEQIIIYLRLANQRNALSAQFESSMTAQQKQLIDAINSTTKDVQTQVEKLNGICGVGYTFSEANVNCTTITTASAKPSK